MSVSVEEAAAFVRARSERRQKALDIQYAAMRSDAERIVLAIVRDFSPIRIYQWGSLLDRSKFRSYSDIDIAVEGVVDAAQWLYLQRRVWDMTNFPLDLVQLERVEPEYTAIIRQKGVVVYERQN